MSTGMATTLVRVKMVGSVSTCISVSGSVSVGVSVRQLKLRML